MQFRGTFANRSTCDLDGVCDRVRVRTFLARTFVKSAKLTIGDTNVCVVEMAIDVVIGGQAVTFTSNRVGQLTQSVKVGRVIKRHSLVKRKTLAVLDLKGDVT